MRPCTHTHSWGMWRKLWTHHQHTQGLHAQNQCVLTASVNIEEKYNMMGPQCVQTAAAAEEHVTHTHGSHYFALLLFQNAHLSNVWLWPWTGSTGTFSCSLCSFQVAFTVFQAGNAGGIQMWSEAAEIQVRQGWAVRGIKQHNLLKHAFRIQINKHNTRT